MKKYNTPEMKVSMFNKESVLTVSSGFATFDAYVEENNIATQNILEKNWSELNISF